MSGTPTSQQAFTPHRLHLTGWLRHRGSGGLRWWQRWLGVVLGVLLAVSMGLDPRLAAADPVSKLPDAQVWEPVASSEAALGGEGGAVSPEQVRPVTPVFPAGSGAVGADAQGRQAWRPVGDTSVEVLTDAAVTVAIADPVVADTAGINGVVFAVALSEGVSATDVRLDYAGFDAAAGGGYGSRLQLVTLPECVLTRPGDPACRKPSPVVSSVNDPKADTVQAQVVAPDGTAATGDVELDGVVGPADGQSARPSSTDTQSSSSAASAEASAGSARPSAAEAGSPSDGGSVQPSVAATGQPSASVSSAGRSAVAVMAAVAGGSGSNGSFEATPLAATGSWSVGGSTGGFEWSYPVSVPVAATGGGLSPNITIGYSSSRVDGKVASSNNQPGWIGQGFDYDPGFIERSYQSCRDTGDEEMEDSGELCWAGEVLTFGRAGFTERLVHDDDTGMYRPQTDDGTRVERLTGADNGALDGEHWKVTTPAGLVYYYGLGTNLWDEGTNSVYTVPVVGLNEGDRCYDSDGVDESRCDQAWRWNVDYAEDTHGNAMVFVYAPETNYYSPDPDSDPLEYVRGGTLERIDYGIRVNGDDVSGPTNSIDFLVDERCIPDDDFGCNPNKFTAKNAKYWPDTPQDLDCDADDCDNYSPSFWSRKRLREINTWVGDTQIDNFLFEQSYPKLGDNSLWLDSITRTGFAPDGDFESYPPVKFGGTLLPNRVEGFNQLPAMYMWRVTRVTDELGGSLLVTYSEPDCGTDDLPDEGDLENNTSRCFPMLWRLPYQDDPTLDFFHTYVVTSVREGDPQKLSPDQLSTYTYLGAPAWHLDESELRPEDQRTYSQFRGYGSVEVRTGDPDWSSNGEPDQVTLTRTDYLRGMDGDQLPDGDTRDVSVTAVTGQQITDAGPLSGWPFQVRSWNGEDGELLRTEVSTPQVLETTASQGRDGVPDLTANIIAATSSTVITETVTGPVETSSSTRFDDRGRAVAQQESASGLPDVCTMSTYADDADDVAWRVATQTKADQACPGSGTTLDTAMITAAARHYYDDEALGVLNGPGDETRTENAVTATGGQLRWNRTVQAWDATGRMTSATVFVNASDTTGRTTSTAYTPADGGPVEQMTIANALGQTTLTSLDLRGTPTSVTDAAGATTSATRDPLGRVTKVWTPDFPASGGVPATEYEYVIDQDDVDALITRTQTSTGTSLSTVTSVELSDGFGQVVQTQATSANGGGRVISDNIYDSHGQVVRTNNAWYTLGGPSTSLMVAADSAIDSRTVTRYDGAGRQVETVAYQGLTEKRRARTVYGGNQVTTLPPEGGTASTTISDARGNTTTLLTYRETPIVDGWSVTGGDPAVTSYRHDTSGRMIQMTDAVGAQWTKTYDLLGRNTSTTDPDTGTTTTTFNDVGEVIATVDARGVPVISQYDKLGRLVRQGIPQSAIAQWTYDTLRPGALTSVTSYTDGNAYTQRVDAYDHAGRPTSATVVIPSAEGALAGSYTTKTTYTQAGQTRTISYPKTGDLPAETVTYSYNTQGMPTTLAGAQTYVKAASWSPHGALSQTIHNQTSSIAQTFYRDPETLRVNEQQLSNTGAYSNVDKTLYTYDQVGKITQTYSERGNGVSTGYRTACYQYNGLSQLTTAWTEAGNKLTPHCATTPSVADGSMVSGAFAMWHEYEWDAVGNRQKITVHPTAITPVGHTTTSTYSYGDASYHALDQTTTDNAVDTSYTYDPAGNTLTRQTADFTEQWAWTPTGKTKSITRDAAVTSYVYTADGTQLIRHDPDTTATLYLPDGTELAAKTSGLEATRYYNFGGQTITQKTKTATWILYADQTGTATVAHHSTTLTTYTRRTIDPYGNQIGPTMGGEWPNTRGYLNLPTSTYTGITDVGARKYDTETGRFTSVDPILVPTDPSSHNGYSYTSADPINQTDPTGLDGTGVRGPFTPRAFPPRTATSAPALVQTSPATASAWDGTFTQDWSYTPYTGGWTHNDWVGLAGVSAAFIPQKTPTLDPFSLIIGDRLHNQYIAWLQAHGIDIESDEFKAGTWMGMVLGIVIPIPAGKAGAAAEVASKAGKASGKLGDAVKNAFTGLGKGTGKGSGKGAAAAEGTAADVAEAGARYCSFTGTTLVLMGDGTKKPIQDIQPGDQVIATNPETGEQETKTVTHTHVHNDTVTDLVIDGETITTTEDHPFWSVTDHQYEPANQLAPGEQVLAANGHTMTVTGLQPTTSRQAPAYNLTVQGIPSYHIGHTETLVHNCPDGGGPAVGKGDSSTSALAGLPEQVQLEVNDAIGRAASGKVRFQKHDGKAYDNDDNLLPKGEYKEWTAAGNGQPRGPHRVIIEGDPSSPNAIYYWDHVNNPIRIR